MTVDTASVRARRYLLGEATHEECAVVEQQYLADEDALEQIAAAEEDLIEDYLSNTLTRGERDRFERVYLSAPHHRVRVETIRRLMTKASASGARPPAAKSNVLPGRFTRPAPWLALAASLLAAVSIAFWLWGSAGVRSTEIAESPTPQDLSGRPAASPAPAPASPRLLAVTLSPISVRSASDSPNLVIPNGTDVVVIQFERETDGRALTGRRASVRTVAGRQVWQGVVASDTALPRGVAARVEVPAGQLPADDYLVTLFGRDRSGMEQEWAQYFLRVRTP